MNKILLTIMAIMAAFMLTACGDYAGDTDANTNETTTINVSNEGDGDVTVNTGSGTVVLNSEGQCLVVLDQNDSRACTIEEVEEALKTMDVSYIATAQTI